MDDRNNIMTSISLHLGCVCIKPWWEKDLLQWIRTVWVISSKSHTDNLQCIFFAGMSPFKAMYGYESTRFKRAITTSNTATEEQVNSIYEECEAPVSIHSVQYFITIWIFVWIKCQSSYLVGLNHMFSVHNRLIFRPNSVFFSQFIRTHSE